MKIYLIDTFTNKLFQGSPAAVVVLDEWCSDSDLVNLSRENAVPESAFLVKKAPIMRFGGLPIKRRSGFAVMLLWPPPML